MPCCVAIRHVAFEDLGLLADVLAARGTAVRYVEAADGLDDVDPLAASLLVVLGGPIGAYEEDDYPFLATEKALIARRIEAGLPTLGLCLGAQMIASALGAAVYPGSELELGWSPLRLTVAGARSCLAPLGAPGLAVLHWHGDTFDLPRGAVHLAASAVYDNQAFAWERHVLALQFHAEVTARGLEHWYVGHAGQLARLDGVAVPDLRAEGRRRAQALQAPCRRIFEDWLDAQSDRAVHR
jgi:GMP synthase (glutamine-hydrolysing)